MAWGSYFDQQQGNTPLGPRIVRPQVRNEEGWDSPIAGIPPIGTEGLPGGWAGVNTAVQRGGPGAVVSGVPGMPETPAPGTPGASPLNTPPAISRWAAGNPLDQTSAERQLLTRFDTGGYGGQSPEHLAMLNEDLRQVGDIGYRQHLLSNVGRLSGGEVGNLLNAGVFSSPSQLNSHDILRYVHFGPGAMAGIGPADRQAALDRLQSMSERSVAQQAEDRQRAVQMGQLGVERSRLLGATPQELAGRSGGTLAEGALRGQLEWERFNRETNSEFLNNAAVRAWFVNQSAQGNTPSLSQVRAMSATLRQGTAPGAGTSTATGGGPSTDVSRVQGGPQTVGATLPPPSPSRQAPPVNNPPTRPPAVQPPPAAQPGQWGAPPAGSPLTQAEWNEPWRHNLPPGSTTGSGQAQPGASSDAITHSWDAISQPLGEQYNAVLTRLGTPGQGNNAPRALDPSKMREAATMFMNNIPQHLLDRNMSEVYDYMQHRFPGVMNDILGTLHLRFGHMTDEERAAQRFAQAANASVPNTINQSNTVPFPVPMYQYSRIPGNLSERLRRTRTPIDNAGR